MAIPEGAHYVPGSGRRLVRLDDGGIVTRGRAENLRAQALSGGAVRTNYQLRQLVGKAKREGLYDSAKFQAVQAEARRKAARMGEPYRPNDVRALGAIVRDKTLIPRDERGRPTGPETAPGGVLDRWLTAIGRREPGTDWAVGETPNAGK